MFRSLFLEQENQIEKNYDFYQSLVMITFVIYYYEKVFNSCQLIFPFFFR